MKEYHVEQIYNLNNLNLDYLVKQSKDEGYHFAERLVKEYKNGVNTFNNAGEALFGVYNEIGELIAFGGLNRDPYSNETIGRVRRFYVSYEYRRKGIGRLLLNRITNEAKQYYNTLVLHTDTTQGDFFYTSFGFIKSELFPNSTHFLEL